MRVVVTGANGFIGSALVRRLRDRAGTTVVAALRRPRTGDEASVEVRAVGDLDERTEWQHALAGADAVVHLAARVHVMRDHAADPLEAFRCVNVAGTRRLAQEAVRLGVRRFVYLSSIKVNGERTAPGKPFRADDPPAPLDPYGTSKLEAERALQEIAAGSSLEVAVVRPPLVYGPGVKANFERMMGWLARGVPLPLGAVDNRRSMVGVRNLCDLIERCTWHPAARGRTFLASDGEDVSTPELLRRLGHALGRPARLLPVPPVLLRAGLEAVGRGDFATRLCGSLQVDIGPTRAALEWQPPVRLDDELRATADHFRSSQR